VTDDHCPRCGGRLVHQGPRWARSYECLQCPYQREDTLTDRVDDVLREYGGHIGVACIVASVGFVALQSLTHAASAAAVAVAAFFLGRTYELRSDDPTTTNVASLASTIDEQLGIDATIRWVYDEGLTEDVYIEGTDHCYQLVFETTPTRRGAERPSVGYRVVRIAPRPVASVRTERDRETFRERATELYADAVAQDRNDGGVSIEVE